MREFGSLHNNGAEHGRIVVTGDDAPKLEFTALGKLPHEFCTCECLNPLCVGIIVLHLWQFLHLVSVFAIFRSRRKDKFMGSAAVVLQSEPDLFPAAYFNARRLKKLLVPFLTHPHFDNAGRLLWIARFAGGKGAGGTP